jgi:hypothetical protein
MQLLLAYASSDAQPMWPMRIYMNGLHKACLHLWGTWLGADPALEII